MTSTPTSWTGWQRIAPARKWVAVVHASSEADARRALLALPWEGFSRDTLVLPANRDPNREKRGR